MFVCPLHQLIKQPFGNDIMVFGGINKLELKELGQQNMPVRIEAEKQPFPVEFFSFFQPDMIYIVAIEALAVLYKYITP